MPEKTLRGQCCFHSETGTESGYWAFQDEKFIKNSGAGFPLEQWSYEGLHILENGDLLTIFMPDDPAQIVWEGEIDLEEFSVFTKSAYGLWIHSDQKGVNRNRWAMWFFKQNHAKLVKRSGK